MQANGQKRLAKMITTIDSPETILENTINTSAADDQLSERERKRILSAIEKVNISPKELIDYSFYLVDLIFRKERRLVTNWQREFVFLISDRQIPKTFLAQGGMVLFGAVNSKRTVEFDTSRFALH